MAPTKSMTGGARRRGVPVQRPSDRGRHDVGAAPIQSVSVGQSADVEGPPDHAALLIQGLAELGLDASAAQLRDLEAYLALLQRWGGVYNLTAVRDPAGMLGQHLLDCLAVIPALDRWAMPQQALAARRRSISAAQDGGGTGVGAALADGGPRNRERPRPTLAEPKPAGPRLLDVGSGGGLPGVVLAIMRPHWTICCVDAVAKKAGFIRQVAAELHLPNLRSLHARVESLNSDLVGPGFDIVTSRAFASLADFCRLTAALLAPTGVWVAMKGKRPADEIASVPAGVEVFHVEQLRVPSLGAQRCLVWMRRGHS